MRTSDIKGLWEAARRFAGRVAPAIVAYEVETKGYVALFIDASGIEVDGRLFQWARKDYDGRRGYWLHAVFLGGLWAAGMRFPAWRRHPTETPETAPSKAIRAAIRCLRDPRDPDPAIGDRPKPLNPHRYPLIRGLPRNTLPTAQTVAVGGCWLSRE